MEAAIRNCGGRQVLSLVNGAFSERFYRIALAHGVEAVALEVPLGAAHTPEMLADALREEILRRGHRRALRDVDRRPESDSRAGGGRASPAGTCCLLVDSVTGVAGAPVESDAWHLDFVLTGSQKALALPPGLALGVAQPAALERARATPNRGHLLRSGRVRELHPEEPDPEHAGALAHVRARGAGRPHRARKASRPAGPGTRRWRTAPGTGSRRCTVAESRSRSWHRRDTALPPSPASSCRPA